MGIKHYTTHTFEHYDRTHDETHDLPLPFDPQGDPEHIYLAENGLKLVLGFLVQDDCPSDPLEDHDEGTFIQFNRGNKHDGPRPELEEWKRIIRANPGRVVPVYSTIHAYKAGQRAMVPADCRNIKSVHGRLVECAAERVLNNMAGYYIAPEDATDPLSYARGTIESYSQWCTGEVYGVVVWTFTRDSIADSWEDPERDECWGYYGHDGYTAEELQAVFNWAVTNGAPSRENTRGIK